MSITIGARRAALLLIPFCAGQTAATGPETTQVNSEEVRTAANDANAFALDLYAKLAGDGSGNIFYSPASISTALAMAYAGARGQTAEEMSQALQLSLDGEALHRAVGGLARLVESERAGSKVSIANALWGQQGYPFREDYLELGRRHYDAALKSVDFRQATEQARATINEWVENETGGKIRDLLAPGSLDPLTRLVLTNAIYFKGIWTREFDPQHTKPAPFRLSAGATVQVDMMHAREGHYRYLETEGLQALALPYGEGETSMIVLLPAEGRSLGSLESELTPEKLEAWLAGLKQAEMDLVALPRFKLTCRYALSSVLRSMGMKRAFAPGADFTGIAAVEDLYISEVVHKAFVEVNEEGTEAAAATGVAIRTTSIQPSFTFVADRPFVFLIQDKGTGAILFIGRVANPTED